MIYTLKLMKGFETLLLGMIAVELALLASTSIVVRVPEEEDIDKYMLALQDHESLGDEEMNT